MSGCPGRITFNVSPWLDVKCHRKPGHSGLCEAMVHAPTHRSTGHLHQGKSIPVWLSWERPRTIYDNDPKEGLL